MDGKTLARIGAVVFVAVAITATAIELTRKEEAPAAAVTTRPAAGAAPMQADLRRCHDMGEAATHDASCLKVWADNRDRFLGAASPEGR